jgi:hypothetical protein
MGRTYTTTYSTPQPTTKKEEPKTSSDSWNKAASDAMFSQAKEMAQIQLDQSKEMMDLSSGYRNKEYSHNAGEDRTSYAWNTDQDIKKNSTATDDSIRSYSAQTDNDIRKNTIAQIDNITVGRAQSENNINEYSQKTTDDMRRDTQQQAFEKGLQQMNNRFAFGMQNDAQKQEQDMFNLNNNADVAKTDSARKASTSLYFGSRM